MASVDMCEHGWAGSGCKDCRIERLSSDMDSAKARNRKFIEENANLIHKCADLEAKIVRMRKDESSLVDYWRKKASTAHNAAIDAAAAQVTLGDTVTNTQRKILALKVGNPPDCAKPFAAEGKVCQFDNCKEDALDRITIDGVAKDYCCEHSDSIVKQKGLRWT